MKKQSHTAGLHLAAPTSLLVKDVENPRAGRLNPLKVLSGKSTEKPSRVKSLLQVLGGSLLNGK